MLRNYKAQLLILAVLILSGMVLWGLHKPTLIAVVDMQRLLNQPAVLLSQSNLSEQEQKKILKQYSSLLPQVLSQYGASHHVTLITATVISSGRFDVTDEVIAATLDQQGAL
ncbi:type-F conjugative transfer system protein TrbI [Fluoribacter gormanii]|uniref:Type-F conjugative transfer system protein TrbI n=1 Tax=Legionella qingyii TaxID=2184757 RepID=A0A317U0M8_9GAMM|nr:MULTISPECIES: type-F conjugative transfer system protein TrbI [Legionellaceae]MCW8472311.1 type-F conjugative transfer system protein TrbI [Fluoribacter gormanii]PWY54755.1 type-F conjugative transfer system protein TrbI [Legionella qingyii]RUR20829.1 type-F conjugative transfer system protein TrbI [Legionella qingyii]